MSFLRWLRRRLCSSSPEVGGFVRYALVGFERSGDTSLGTVPIIVRSLSWAEELCSQWNREQSDIYWHIAILEPDAAIYGKTGLSDE
jgi:hypothetical protein